MAVSGQFTNLLGGEIMQEAGLFDTQKGLPHLTNGKYMNITLVTEWTM